MNQLDLKPPTATQPRGVSRIFRIVLWIGQAFVFAFFALIAVGVAFDLRKAGIAKAPVVLLYATLTATTVVALLHLPPLFMRLSKRLRWGAYALVIPTTIMFGIYAGQMRIAYERTPEGAKEAAAQRVADIQEAKAQAAREEGQSKAQAEAEATSRAEAKIQANLNRVRQVIEQRKKVDACFSFFGHRLPNLESQVRESLGNPDAFKHVKTESIDPDGDGYNVEMVFRAQNIFSAIIKTSVRARVNPDTCAVEDVSGTS